MGGVDPVGTSGEGTEQQRAAGFCSQCAAGLPAGARFCPRCGAQVVLAAPPSAGTVAASAEASTRARRPRWGRLLLVGVVAGALVGVAMVLFDWPVDLSSRANESDAGTVDVLSSPYFDEVIDEFGYPHTWWLIDPPDISGAESVRVESWFYPAEGVEISFIGGWRGPPEYFTAEEAAFESYSDVTPTDLHHSMTVEEVDAVVGAEREFLESLPTDVGDTELWAYVEAGLVVQFLGDRFFSARTI